MFETRSAEKPIERKGDEVNEGGRTRFYVLLAGIITICIGIVGVELGFLANSDPGNAPDILTEISTQEIAVIGGVVFTVIGAVLVLMEFREYRICPACGKETFDANLLACPQCGRQLPQRKGKGV